MALTCFRCGKTPEELEEYQPGNEDSGASWEEGDFESPSDYVRQEEGTYNPETKRFCCTTCYIAIGMPSTPQGWKAP